VKSFCFAIGLLLSVPSISQTGDKDLEAVVDGYIQRGIRATVLQKYSLAKSTFDSLRIFLPEDPRPYFYLAALLQSQMMDLEHYDQEHQFFELIDTVIVAANAEIQTEPDRAMAYFFKGAAHSYRGYYYAQRRDYLKGIRDCMVGVKFLEEAVSRDSSFYDAYLGIGTFWYWRSRLTHLINWLPFIQDKSQEGLAMVMKSAELGRFSREAALNGLIWIRIDRREFTQAIQLALQMLEEFPQSRFFLWPLAEAYFRAGNFINSIETFEQLEESYRGEPGNNHYNEFVCGSRVMEAHLKMNEPSKACEMAADLMGLPLSPPVRNRLSGKLAQVKKVSDNCVSPSQFDN
jgi:tetratricopeptide (TPR) repeat protein